MKARKNTEKTETKGKKKGRCAIVVGASSGIGRETALRLAARGDTVFNLSRTASVPPVRTITADASEEGAFARAIENVCRETGGLDLLIYCAGYSCLAPVAYAKSEDYRYLFEVNYFGAVECLRAAAPFLRKRGGRAVLVGSMGGEMPIPYDGFYSASKAALAMLARETDMEWRSRGVRVSALLPGGTAKGAMFFNPIKKFRELEEEQKKKGIGDANDGSIHATAEKAWISQSNKMAVLNNANISVITDPALKIPAYCLRKTETEYISAIYREKLREQFPEHTHALIIEDEEEFLEQVRYRFRNKAFAHDIFYQDDFLLDFWNFLKCGQSDIMFYKPNAKKRYYSEMLFEHNSGTREYLRIDDSNFYRTAFRKDIFFSDQKEFRIVLPHEKIIAGKIYEVGAIRSTLVKIDDLVKD